MAGPAETPGLKLCWPYPMLSAMRVPCSSSDIQVTEVEEAWLFHQQHHVNFYHLFTEVAPTMHYVLCKYLGRCSYQVCRHGRGAARRGFDRDAVAGAH